MDNKDIGNEERRQEEVTMNARKEEVSISRRTMLKGSAVIIAGGVGGGLATAYAAAVPKKQDAPPLPWKWVNVDPMEAGRRAFHYYLKEKG